MDYQVLSTILGDSIQVKIVEFFIINNTGMTVTVLLLRDIMM